MEQTKEVKLAYKIAQALNDLHSIDWHIKITSNKDYPEELLLEKLHFVLTDPKTRNAAKRYNDIIQRYGKHPRS